MCCAVPQVDEECPKCGHRRLAYYTLQLRSADEGQTVFYECVKCMCVCPARLARGVWNSRRGALLPGVVVAGTPSP